MHAKTLRNALAGKYAAISPESSEDEEVEEEEEEEEDVDDEDVEDEDVEDPELEFDVSCVFSTLNVYSMFILFC